MRKFAPLTADHPAVAESQRCAGCERPFAAGDETTLVPKRHVEGWLWEASLLHWDCGRNAQLAQAADELNRWKQKCWDLEADMDCRNELSARVAMACRERDELRELVRDALPHLAREHHAFVEFNEEEWPTMQALVERMRKAVGE